MKIGDFKKFDDNKELLIEADGKVFELEVDHESDIAVWLKVVGE